MTACLQPSTTPVRFRSSETFERPSSGFRKPGPGRGRPADVFGRSRSLHGPAIRPKAGDAQRNGPWFRGEFNAANDTTAAYPGNVVQVVSGGVTNTANVSTFVGPNNSVWHGKLLIAELNSFLITLRSYKWGVDVSSSVSGAAGIGGLLMVNGISPDDALLGQQWTDYALINVAQDGAGNVVGMYDMYSRTKWREYEYDGFGRMVAERKYGGSAHLDKIPLRHATRILDPETGLQAYHYRLYSPWLGRWLSRDPIGEAGGLNLYGMVGNNPVNYVDPLGLDLITTSGISSGLGGYTRLPANPGFTEGIGSPRGNGLVDLFAESTITRAANAEHRRQWIEREISKTLAADARCAQNRQMAAAMISGTARGGMEVITGFLEASAGAAAVAMSGGALSASGGGAAFIDGTSRASGGITTISQSLFGLDYGNGDIVGEGFRMALGDQWGPGVRNVASCVLSCGTFALIDAERQEAQRVLLQQLAAEIAPENLATTPLMKNISGVADDALVHFGPEGYSVVMPGSGGQIFSFRYGDIKHLTPRQVENVIGNELTVSGQRGGSRVMHVLDANPGAATRTPGSVVPEIPEFIFEQPIPILEGFIVQ